MDIFRPKGNAELEKQVKAEYPPDEIKGEIELDDKGWFARCPNCDTIFRRRKDAN